MCFIIKSVCQWVVVVMAIEVINLNFSSSTLWPLKRPRIQRIRPPLLAVHLLQAIGESIIIMCIVSLYHSLEAARAAPVRHPAETPFQISFFARN